MALERSGMWLGIAVSLDRIGSLPIWIGQAAIPIPLVIRLRRQQLCLKRSRLSPLRLATVLQRDCGDRRRGRRPGRRRGRGELF